MPTFEQLSCPIDKQSLSLQERSLVCPNGHSFDIAKSGYVNLLPVQNKRSKDPGDSKEMVSYRQSFLNLDHYFPIVKHMIDQWPDALKAQSPCRVLDAGCGEGYYLHHLLNEFSQRDVLLQGIGLDISKWAVTAASKRTKNATWIVGSNAGLPMPDKCLDLVLCLFGFPVFSEFYRTLSDQGYMLLVESGEEHLLELREILYPSIHAYKATHSDGIEGFTLVAESSLHYPFKLNSQDEIHQLLCMTPHIHKASYEGKEAVKELNEISVTAHVKFRWYQKATEEDHNAE
ncbi:putative RNA methyltransferase [Marinomonas pollencensis]|uniref:23S rRNA m(1)G-745 methyltransferase n=1 Tax=Marinomonas pollencensis TaxID=491954 RepID=A0A3E0DSH1_9GAMM|nr:methyltransferase domain-containing protein [Marinomonas pollencensis]REG86472.1 23S rRNA m(1)G-745 methyltransferase [Marinomonas pollencensis]